MSLEKFGEMVWDNWMTGTGPCGRCPNRDCDGHWSPVNFDAGVYSGDANPSIVFVGDAPNKHDPETGERRPRRDFGESKWEGRTETYAEKAENRGHVQGWILDNRVPEWFFDEIGYHISEDGGGYFTNAKKCADVHPKGANTRENARSRWQCGEYLEEQLGLLDPKIVVPLSSNATQTIFEIYGIDWPGKLKKVATKVFDAQDPVVVPSYHWSPQRFAANVTHIPEVESGQEYWEQLAQAINSV